MRRRVEGEVADVDRLDALDGMEEAGVNASRDGEPEEIADLDLRGLSDTHHRVYVLFKPTILACSCRHRSWQGSMTPSSACSSSGTQPLPMASSDISFHMRALQVPKSAELSVFASLSSMSSVGRGLRGTMALLFAAREGAVCVGGKVLTKSDSAGRLGPTRDGATSGEWPEVTMTAQAPLNPVKSQASNWARIEAERSELLARADDRRAGVATLALR